MTVQPGTRPLWALCTLNDDALPQSTAGETFFEYVDIGDVTTGRIAPDVERYTFDDAPSRARRLAAPGDVIVSTVRTYLRAIAQVGEAEAGRVYSTGFAVFRPILERADPRFLAYTLLSGQVMDEIVARSEGVSYPAITGSALHRMRVPTHPLTKQQAIADYLDHETSEIDAMIRKLDALGDVLHERARTLVSTRVLGLTEAGELGRFDPRSPLTGIPTHWRSTKFGYDLFESTERNGDTPPGPLLSISEYRGVEVKTREDGQKPSEDVSDYRVVRPGQLAANMMWLNHGGLGVSDVTGYISPDYKAFDISQRFESRYVHYLLRSTRYVSYFDAIGNGVRPNAQRVTKTVLDAMPLPLPPIDEQRQIVAQLDAVTGKIDAMQAKIADLKALLTERREALITEVVTGRKEIE